jgi:hypothetical protein
MRVNNNHSIPFKKYICDVSNKINFVQYFLISNRIRNKEKELLCKVDTEAKRSLPRQ